MRRPQAIDRRVAAGLFMLGALAVLVTAGVADAPSQPLPAPDPSAARELVQLLRAGEAQSWMVTYTFTRKLADGRVMHQTMREARNRDLHVLLAGSSMTIESPHRAYDCTLVGDRTGCSATDSTQGLPESEVLRVAVNAGAYGVSRLPGATVAGEHARCFRVLATGHGGLPDVGVETDFCLSSDGIALRERILRATGDVDERDAVTVGRKVSTASIEALAESFDPDAPPAAR